MSQRIDKCPACKGPLSVDASLAGGRIQCPHCGRQFKVAVHSKSSAAGQLAKPAPKAESVQQLPVAAPADVVASGSIGGDEVTAAVTEDEFASMDLGSEEFAADGPGIDEFTSNDEASADVAAEEWGEDSTYALSQSEPVAPPPRPRKKKRDAGSAKSGKKRSSAEESQWYETMDRRIVAAAAGGGLLLVLLMIGGIVFAVRALSGGGSSTVAADVEVPKGDYVIFDEPTSENPVAQRSLSVFTPAAPPSPDAVKVVSLRRPAPVEAQDPAEAIPPRWNIPADPRPAEPVSEYMPDLRIPLQTTLLFGNVRTLSPILADRNGPFALLMPNWTEEPYTVATEVVNGMARGVLREKPQAPPTVVDLRTGETVGEFSWKSPFWCGGRLSPTAEYLVGPDAAPYWLRQPAYPGLAIPEPGALFVWTQKRDEPVHKFAVEGVVLWAEFVGNEQFAVYLVGEACKLQIWNVATGKISADVPLSVAPFQVVTDPEHGHWGYFVSSALGTVSPGRQYVAVGGLDAISLVSLAVQQQVGVLPVTLSENNGYGDYLGVSFTSDGERLSVATHLGSNRQEFKTWSVTTGVELSGVALSASGRFLPGPLPDTLVAAGFPFTGWRFDFWQEAADPHKGASFLDATTGRLLFMYHAFARWSESGPSLAVGPIPDENGQMELPLPGVQMPRIFLYATQDYLEPLREAAGKTEFGLAKRPDPVEPDRSAVQLIVPEPPANWTAPPASSRPDPPTEFAHLTERPAAFGGNELAVLRLNWVEHKRPYDSLRVTEVNWERYELLTGKRAGETITLWPWARDPNKPYPQPDRLIAALSADDQMLAARDPESPGRVDVWSSEGTRLVGFCPMAPDSTIDWLGWDPQHRLLTLCEGCLTAWEVPAATAVYEIDGGYILPIDFAYGREWFALAARTHVDLIDSASGRCLARCATGAPGSYTDLAISLDGARLAAVCVADDTVADGLRAHRVNQSSDQFDYHVVLWDLKTGKAELTKRTLSRYALLHWGAPEHLAVIDGNATVFDLRAGNPVLNYAFYGSWPTEGLPHSRSPDGRLWVAVESAYQTWDWITANLPNSQGEQDSVFLAEDRRYFTAPDEPIQVEIDCGSSALAEKFGLTIVSALEARGFRMGSGGWRLIVSHTVGQSGGLTSGMTEIPIPKVDYLWQLLDEQGHEVWRETHSNYWLGTSSQYYTKTRDAYDFAPGERQLSVFEYEEQYDFGMRDPEDAMLDEVLEQGPGVNSLTKLPPLLLKVGNSYQTFPVNLTLEAELPQSAPEPAGDSTPDPTTTIPVVPPE